MPDPLQQPAQLRKVLWAVLLASQAIYAGIVLSGRFTVGEPAGLEPLAAALAAGAAALGFVAHLFWRRAVGAGQSLHAEAPPEAQVHTSYVMAWVLDEAIAVCALLLGLLGFAAPIWASFFALSMTLMILHRPR